MALLEIKNLVVSYGFITALKGIDISVEKGQTKYRAYFVSTKIYARYQDKVNAILQTDGYDACIVTE